MPAQVLRVFPNPTLSAFKQMVADRDVTLNKFIRAERQRYEDAKASHPHAPTSLSRTACTPLLASQTAWSVKSKSPYRHPSNLSLTASTPRRSQTAGSIKSKDDCSNLSQQFFWDQVPS